MTWPGERWSETFRDVDRCSRVTLWALLILGSGTWAWQGWKHWKTSELALRTAAPVEERRAVRESAWQPASHVTRVDEDPFTGTPVRR